MEVTQVPVSLFREHPITNRRSQSPTLSRSSSFAPGSRRRSQPNLQHLSLAPLTPKYPIFPADYDAYFDPSTAELHTSSSLSQIAALPSPSGILRESSSRSHSRTRSHAASAAASRATSRTRPRKSAPKSSRSAVSLAPPPPSGALSSAGFGHIATHNAHSGPKSSSSHLRLHTSDSTWLIHAGLSLTESSRETKGQSWIAQRDSSTSLHTPRTPLADERDRFDSVRHATPSHSRRGSRRRLKALSMTPALMVTPGDELAGPDWDESVKASEHVPQAAAGAVEDDDDDDEDGEDYDDADPYGMLDFEGQFDSADEEDVRQEITKYHLGKWMDGVIDVFLQLEEFDAGEKSDILRATRRAPPVLDGVALESERDTASHHQVERDETGVEVEAPPERPQGVWDDVAWFGRLVARAVRQ